jgi:membrane-associated protein
LDFQNGLSMVEIFDLLKGFLDFFLHLDEHLFTMINEYGVWIYVILFLIIFVETGLVVMPFLPGDSLLFAAGTFCAGVVKSTGESAQLNLFLVLGLLFTAAVLGDSLNYWSGKNIGLRVLRWKIKNTPIVNPKHVEKTQLFFDKHGSKTIIIARFVPIVRTFAPFVAGVGNMLYSRFIKFNVIGAFLWIFSLTLAGYFFGNLPWVQNNFETVIFSIIILSLLPMVFEYLKHTFTKA